MKHTPSKDLLVWEFDFALAKGGENKLHKIKGLI